MAAIGGNIPRDGSTPPAHIRGLNMTWARVVAPAEDDLTSYLKECRAAGLKVLLVIARESGTDYSGLFERYHALVDAVQAGNEPDLESESSWTMTKEEFEALGKAVRKAWPRPFHVVAGGLASGHPSWLADIDLSWCDTLAVHPYAKDGANPDDLEDMPDVQDLLRSYAAFGKPLIVSEWGWPSDEEPRASQEVWDLVSWAAATAEIEAFFYFAVHDHVSPFGLLDINGKRKLKAKVFKEAAATAVHSAWPEAAQPTDLRDYARAMAVRYGWSDPEMFVRQIQQESTFNPAAHNAVSGADGIAQIVTKWHPTMQGLTQDPYISLDYSARWMAELYAQFGSWVRALAAYNWGPGNVRGWNGRPDTLPKETRTYLEVIIGPDWFEHSTVTRVQFNPNEPAHPQEETFDCSQESLEWAMWSYGNQVDGEEMEQAMIVQRVLSPQYGLLNASGADLAEFIRTAYGEAGFTANHEPGSSPDWTEVTFDAVAAEAGTYALLIGGRAWNHWSGVRGYNASSDRLLLANPAHGHKGIYQEMSREQFEALGPFTMVRVLHQDIIDSLNTPPEDKPAVPVDVADVLKTIDAMESLIIALESTRRLRLEDVRAAVKRAT